MHTNTALNETISILSNSIPGLMFCMMYALICRDVFPLWRSDRPHVSKAELRQVGELFDLDDGVVQGGLQSLGHHVGQDYRHHHGEDVRDLTGQLKADDSCGHSVSHRSSQCCRSWRRNRGMDGVQPTWVEGMIKASLDTNVLRPGL